VTPSREIYNRVLWDARLDRGAFVIGYQDRHAPEGIQETPLVEWDPEGDVPWHRIRYFRCGETIVWDRDMHIDLFASDALPPDAWVEGAAPPASQAPGPVHLTAETREALLAARPVYRSAVVVIPPEEVWPPIQAIRRLHDRNVERWMPHVTLVYGFVPEDFFDDASRLIAAALAGMRPFRVRLEGFGTFRHRASTTAWLRPLAEPSDALRRLQGAVQALFPQCDEQTVRPSGFVPHLSVGQFRSPADAAERLPDWTPLEFAVDAVALISRHGDGPFEVRHRVPLGGAR
jgi:2'-5' RNA ligase/uncharacterized protein (UPF0248 family)